MANFFDQFDAPAPASSGNFFAQFDGVPKPAAPVPPAAPAVSQYNDLPVPGSARADGTIVPGVGVEGTAVNQPSSSYDRFRSSDNLVDSIMAAGDYTAETASNFAEGARKGAANVLGLPADLLNAAPMLANVIPGVEGVGPFSKKPSGGSAMFSDLLVDGYGLIPDAPKPADAVQRGANRLGEEIGAASVPTGAVLGTTAKMTAAEARALPEIVKNLFGADKAAVNPAKFVADETRVAAGAGIGAATVNEITGNDRSTAGGQLIDAGGAVGGAVTTGLGTALVKAFGNVGTAVFNPAKYVDDGVNADIVDKIMGEAGYRTKSGEIDDTEALVNSIMRGEKVGDTIPGYVESLADRTKNSGIAALEYAHQSKPGSTGAFNRRRADNTVAVDNAMKPFEPTETPGAFADAAFAERNKRLTKAAIKASDATTAWENSTRSLLPVLNAEGRGANIRTALQDASDSAKTVLAQAWAPINNSRQSVDMEALDAIFRGTDENLSMAERNRFRPAEADIPATLMGEGDEAAPMQPLNEITGIRSALSDAAREANTAGKVNEARIIGQYIDGLDTYMRTNLPSGGGSVEYAPTGTWKPYAGTQKKTATAEEFARVRQDNSDTRDKLAAILDEGTKFSEPDQFYQRAYSTAGKEPLARGETWRSRVEANIGLLDQWLAQNKGGAAGGGLAEQYEAARVATVDFNDRFTRPQTAIAQTLSEREGMPRYPDSAIPNKFVQGDQGRIADFEALMKEAGSDDRVQTAVRDQILQDVKDRGLLEKPGALQSYLDGYSNVFAKFPALKAQLGDAKNLRAEMDTATTASTELTDQLTKQGRSAVANYLQYGNENAERAMRGVIGAKDPKKAVDELLTFVGDDAKAVEGARKTFWDIMQKDARSGGRTTGDINGAQPWSPYSLNKFLEDPVNSVVLERLYRDNPKHLENIRGIAAAIKGTETRNSARVVNTSGTAQGVNNTLTPETIQSRLYAYQTGKIGLTFVMTALVSVLARRSVKGAREQALTRVLDDVLLNPDAAAVLLRENNPANRKALSRYSKSWFGNEASSIINAMSAEDQDEDTKTIMED